MFRTLAQKAAALVVVGLLAATALPERAEAWMCVTHVRNMTGITTIRGDAWAWWQNAEGQFARGQIPTPGAIMVWRRAGNLPRGHVGVVREIVDSRTVLIDHSWDSNTLRYNQRIEDVSPNNDWSRISVWYHPLQVMGGEYALYGFVYPPGSEPSAESMAEMEAEWAAERTALLTARAAMARELEASGRLGSEREMGDPAPIAEPATTPQPTPVPAAPRVSTAVPARNLDEASRHALEVAAATRARLVAARSVVNRQSPATE